MLSTSAIPALTTDNSIQSELARLHTQVSQLKTLDRQADVVVCQKIIELGKNLTPELENANNHILGNAYFLLGVHQIRKYENGKIKSLRTAELHLREAFLNGVFDACIHLQSLNNELTPQGDELIDYRTHLVEGLALKKSKLERFTPEENKKMYDLLISNWQTINNYSQLYLLAESIHHMVCIQQNHSEDVSLLLGQKIASNEFMLAGASQDIDRTPLAMVYYFRDLLSGKPIAITALINFFAQQNNKVAKEIKQELLKLQSYFFLFPTSSITLNSLIKIVKASSRMFNFPEFKFMLLMEIAQASTLALKEMDKIDVKCVTLIDSLVSQIQSFITEVNKQSNVERTCLAAHFEEKLVTVRKDLKELRARLKTTNQATPEATPAESTLDLESLERTGTLPEYETLILRQIQLLSDEEKLSLIEVLRQTISNLGIDYFTLYSEKETENKEALFKAQTFFSWALDRENITSIAALLMTNLSIISLQNEMQIGAISQSIELLGCWLDKVEEDPAVFNKLPVINRYKQIRLMNEALIEIYYNSVNLKLSVPNLLSIRDRFVKLASSFDLEDYHAKVCLLLGKVRGIGEELVLSDFLKASVFFLTAFFLGEKQGMQLLVTAFNGAEMSSAHHKKFAQIGKAIEVESIKNLITSKNLYNYKDLLQEFDAVARQTKADKQIDQLLFAVHKTIVEFLLDKINKAKPGTYDSDVFLAMKNIIEHAESRQPHGTSEMTTLKTKFLQTHKNFSNPVKGATRSSAKTAKKKSTNSSKKKKDKQVKKNKKTERPAAKPEPVKPEVIALATTIEEQSKKTRSKKSKLKDKLKEKVKGTTKKKKKKNEPKKVVQRRPDDCGIDETTYYDQALKAQQEQRKQAEKKLFRSTSALFSPVRSKQQEKVVVAVPEQSTSAPSAPVSPVKTVPLNNTKVKTILAHKPHYYAVGGFVREYLRQLEFTSEPDISSLNTSDIDFVAFEALPTENFKIDSYEFAPHSRVNELLLFRCEASDLDMYYTPAKDLEEDANARDFTINALYLKYREDGSGEVLDPTGRGLSDLREKIIRTIVEPEIIFADDPIVIFRYLALITAGYKGLYTPEFLSQFYPHLDNVDKVKPGQIFYRLIRASEGGKAAASMATFQEYGLFKKLFPNINQNQYAWLNERLLCIDAQTLAAREKDPNAEFDAVPFFASLLTAALRSTFQTHVYTDTLFTAHFRWLLKQFPIPPALKIRVEEEYMPVINLAIKDYKAELEKSRAVQPVVPRPAVSASQNHFRFHRSMSVRVDNREAFQEAILAQKKFG